MKSKKRSPLEVALDKALRNVAKTARLQERARIVKIVQEARDSLSTAWEATLDRAIRRICSGK